MIDEEKHRREFARWVLLLALNNARPIGAWEEVLLSILQAIYPDATRHEVQRELGYLDDSHLVTIKKHSDGRWFLGLTSYGTDIAEYAVDCQPGIARPRRY